MRVTYQLSPISGMQGQFAPIPMVSEPPPLEMNDRYVGEVGESSTICESDLAPFKPRCDVLLTGAAYAPDGIPARNWPVHVRLSTQHSTSQNDNPSRTTLLDKALMVHGPRVFERVLGGWRLREAIAATSVPLAYELSYGGRSSVRVPENNDSILDEVCFLNPLGRGWQHAEFETQAQKAQLPVPDAIAAPQIEAIENPIVRLDVVAQPKGPLSVHEMERVSKLCRHSPVGFGPIGRAWTPRIQHAGTHDDEWLAHRWPYLPDDFDMSYWNCAPQDQQIPYPPPDLVIDSLNLVDSTLTKNGHASFRLPGHRAGVLFRLKSGLLLGASPVIDTIHINLTNLRVAVVWRAAITVEMHVNVAEARFEKDPTCEIFRLARMARKLTVQESHG